MHTQKIAITFNHILRAIMALDHSRLGLENKSGRIFLRSTRLIYKILPTSLGTCKPTFYTFYASHLRWNSTMSRCFYHTDLGQNAVFHNFAIQISLIQYWGRSKQVWAFSQTVKKISKIILTNQSIKIGWRLWLTLDLGEKSQNQLACLPCL